MSGARILQVQNFSVNDGDGIRSTVFLAGCPLRCAWCSNPEGMTAENKTAWYQKTCVGCGKCVKACPKGIDINLNVEKNRLLCDGCGQCADVCASDSRKRMVTDITTDELLRRILPYTAFYRASGGGVTFSGGEAFLQKEFLFEASKRLYDSGIDLAVETSAYFDFDAVKHIIPLFDTMFIDIKHMDAEKHIYYTGRDNALILENIKKIYELNKNIVIRIPVIEGVNDSNANICLTARFVGRNISGSKIELLPYHKYGEVKYEALGLKPPNALFAAPDGERIKELRRLIEKEGVETVEYK